MALLEAIGTAAASSAVSGGVSAATSAVNNKRKYKYWLKQQDQLEQQQKRAEQRQFDYNKELQDYAYQRNLEQWERENEYNSPTAQMERYRQAGLNGNLIYGQSNLAASSPEMSIGDVGSGSAPSASPLDIDGVNIDPSTLQHLINETKLANANVENIDADTEKKKEETENVTEDTRGKKIENDFKQDLSPIKIEQAVKELEKTNNQNELLKAQVKNTNLDSALKWYEQQIKQLDIKIKQVDADHADELMQLRIKRENAQISFVNHQIAMLGKQIASYDEELKSKLALQAADILNKTAFANLAAEKTTYQQFINKLNDILLDPTTDTDTSTYWSALFLKNLNETSFMDVISEARKWFFGMFDSGSDDAPSNTYKGNIHDNELPNDNSSGNQSDGLSETGREVLERLKKGLGRH